MSKAARGLRSDGEATRTRILEAAGELFAVGGYAETPNKSIAARAEVDLASINYHFGNRSGLYQAVLAASHSQLFNLADLRQLVESTAPPPAKLRIVIEQLVRYASQEQQGWPLRVLAREVMAPSSHLQVLVQNEAMPKVALMKRLLSQVTQIPEQDPALTRCLLSVIAPCLMLVVSGRTFPGPLQDIFEMPSQAIATHLYDYAMGGLNAISLDYAKQVSSNRRAAGVSAS